MSRISTTLCRPARLLQMVTLLPHDDIKLIHHVVCSDTYIHVCICDWKWSHVWMWVATTQCCPCNLLPSEYYFNVLSLSWLHWPTFNIKSHYFTHWCWKKILLNNVGRDFFIAVKCVPHCDNLLCASGMWIDVYFRKVNYYNTVLHIITK